MANITTNIIKAVAPSCREPELWSKLFSDAITADGKFDTVEIAAFLSQCAHESGDFNVLEENLNYSAEALVKLWPNRFNRAYAGAVARKPAEIANIVYAGRLGNGVAASGDGYRYRGRGLIQITGKNAYRAFSVTQGIDLVTDPDKVASNKKLAIASALWYWTNNIRGKVIMSSVISVTKKVNGGTNGLADRSKRFVAAQKALAL